MIDVMAKMMPFMRPIALAGGGLALLALLLSYFRGPSGRGEGLSAFAARLTLWIGLFFIACEIAGRFLGMEPTLLFAADPFDRELYRNQWPFWTVGLALVAVWAVAELLERKALEGMTKSTAPNRPRVARPPNLPWVIRKC